MATSKVQRPHRRLVQLLFFASASTAAIISIGDTSLTLSNFQLITQLSVPLGCLLAYNSPIQGCTSSDFANGATCSAKCRRGLTRMQETIQDSCQAVQVQTNTLLGQALAGNLVNLLCPSANTQPTSSAVQPVPPSSTPIAQPSTSAVVIPPAPPPSTTSKPVVIPPKTSSTAPIPPPSQSTVISPPSSTVAPPASQPSTQPPPLASPTTIATSANTKDSSPQSTSTETATVTAPVNPLDALLMSGGSEKSMTVSTGTIYSLFLFWGIAAMRGV